MKVLENSFFPVGRYFSHLNFTATVRNVFRTLRDIYGTVSLFSNNSQLLKYIAGFSKHFYHRYLNEIKTFIAYLESLISHRKTNNGRVLFLKSRWTISNSFQIVKDICVNLIASYQDLHYSLYAKSLLEIVLITVTLIRTKLKMQIFITYFN